MRILITFFFILFITPKTSNAQTVFKLPEDAKRETVKFQFINNLIIIPVEVNGVRLSFILDTGVNKPILFNLSDSDSLNIKNVNEVFIRGLGGGDAIKAYHSKGNRFKINKIYNNNQDFYIILDEQINLSPSLGVPVHGIIGYDFIKNFVLDINYISKKIRFYKKNQYEYKNCRKCEQFDLEIFKNKPYIKSRVVIEDAEETEVKLLIDSGSSDALWLFEDPQKNITVPEKKFRGFLGRGLSGDIHGERSRVSNFRLGSFDLEDAKVSFPDSVSIRFIKKENDRNGSVGADILKRFRVILDYNGKKLMLRKNSNFDDPFKYNMSGIELQHNGIRYVKELASNFNNKTLRNQSETQGFQIAIAEKFKISLHPAFVITEIRKDSPADLAGLKENDILISVNGKQTYNYSLQEVNELLNEKVGKKIKLVVDRGGEELRFNFQLKKVL